MSTFPDPVVTLALAIADEEARCHIECNCRAERIGAAVWWDTSADDDGGDDADEVDVVVTTPTCVRYLEQRDSLVRHPTRPELVRFALPPPPTGDRK